MKKLLSIVLLASVLPFNSESYANIPQPKKYNQNKSTARQYTPDIPAYNLPLDISISIPESPKSLN